MCTAKPAQFKNLENVGGFRVWSLRSFFFTLWRQKKFWIFFSSCVRFKKKKTRQTNKHTGSDNSVSSLLWTNQVGIPHLVPLLCPLALFTVHVYMHYIWHSCFVLCVCYPLPFVRWGWLGYSQIWVRVTQGVILRCCKRVSKGNRIHQI